MKKQKQNKRQPRDYILNTDHGYVVWRMNIHASEIEIAADNYKAIVALVRNAATYLHEKFQCCNRHKDFDDYKYHKSYTYEQLKKLSRPRDNDLISGIDRGTIFAMNVMYGVIPKIAQL